MNILERFRDIHTFIFDVDGVMTNSQLMVLENGQLLRSMSVRDGFALRAAVAAGYRVAIITGGQSSGVVKRLQGLGIQDIYKGVADKVEVYREYIHLYDLDPAGILYMGDDVPDLGVMRLVGLPACPANAVPEVRAISQYVSPIVGGEGCVRDVIEKVLKLAGRWPAEGDAQA